jgi:hypothetical protein
MRHPKTLSQKRRVVVCSCVKGTVINFFSLLTRPYSEYQILQYRCRDNVSHCRIVASAYIGVSRQHKE